MAAPLIGAAVMMMTFADEVSGMNRSIPSKRDWQGPNYHRGNLDRLRRAEAARNGALQKQFLPDGAADLRRTAGRITPEKNPIQWMD